MRNSAIILLIIAGVAACAGSRRCWIYVTPSGGKGLERYWLCRSWERRYWIWFCQGVIVPLLIWSIFNAGWSDRFPHSVASGFIYRAGDGGSVFVDLGYIEHSRRGPDCDLLDSHHVLLGSAETSAKRLALKGNLFVSFLRNFRFTQCGSKALRIMADETSCRGCGAALTDDARDGICPRCLFAQGAGPEFDFSARENSLAEPFLTSQAEFPREFGDYELIEEIARGGMGVVYRARHASLDRTVAVKLLLFGPLASAEFVKRFRAEASAAASLQHPNIVAIHEVGVHQGQQYFAMDYVEGKSLSKVLASGPLTTRTTARYLKIIAHAIHYAHERGILHRDLKPSNVLIDANDEPRITDFGLAKRLDGQSDLTLTGQMLGSPNYMPPEQAAAQGKVSRRSDVYSLGAMLYHLLTGRPPFVGETVAETLRRVENDDPVSPRLLRPGVPRDLETICLNCLHKEPARRYPTAQALADELGRFLKDEPITARPVNRVEKIWRWCRRKPALASFASATGVLLLAILIGSPIALYHVNKQFKRAEIEALNARRNLYAAHMNQAERALQDDDIFLADQLLERHRKDEDLRGWEWRYLWGQCRGDERFLLWKEPGAMLSAGLLSDGKTAFFTDFGNTVPLWDIESRRQIGVLMHANSVSGAAASADGRMMATSSGDSAKDQSIQIWDLATRKVQTILTTNFFCRPWSILFSPDSKRLAFGTYSEGIRLWDIDARSEITNFPALNPQRQNVLLAMAFSPDGQNFAYSENGRGDIALRDMHNYSFAGRLTNHQSHVMALAFSRDSQTLASGGDDRVTRLWDVPTSAQRLALTNHSGGIISLAFSPDGATLAIGASGGAGRIIRLVNASTGVENVRLRGHALLIQSLAFTPDDRTLLSSSMDGTIRVWNTSPRQPEKTTHKFAQDSISRSWSRYGSAVCLSLDGLTLLTHYNDETFSFWDTLTFKEGEHHPMPLAQTTFGAVANGGKLAVFGNARGEVALWDEKRRQARFVARPETGVVHRLAFSPDGHQFAIGYSDTIRLWDVGTEEETHVLPSDGDVPMSLAFSRDGAVLLRGSVSGSVKLWPILELDQPTAFVGNDRPVRALALTPDGRTLISSTKELRFWEVGAGLEIFKVVPRGGFLGALAITPDGQRLAASLIGGLILIYDMSSHEEVARLQVNDEFARDIAFTPDGDHLVSASQNQLRVWRAASFEETDRKSRKQ